MIFPDPPEAIAPTAAPAPVLLRPTPPQHDAASLWSWTDLALFLAFAAMAFLFSSFTVTVGYVALKTFAGWQASSQTLANDPIFPITLELVFYSLLLCFVYVLIVNYHRQPFWSSLRWRRPEGRKLVGYLLGGFLLATAVGLAPTLLPDKETFPLQQLFKSPRAAYLVAVFAVFIAPFMEELIFRGVLFAVFERRAGVRFAIIATALLFGALHIPEYQGAWNHLFLIFMVSVVFSLTRGLTGSLAPSMILHFSYNLSLMVGLYFATHHFRSLPSTLASILTF